MFTCKQWSKVRLITIFDYRILAWPLASIWLLWTEMVIPYMIQDRWWITVYHKPAFYQLFSNDILMKNKNPILRNYMTSSLHHKKHYFFDKTQNCQMEEMMSLEHVYYGGIKTPHIATWWWLWQTNKKCEFVTWQVLSHSFMFTFNQISCNFSLFDKGDMSWKRKSLLVLCFCLLKFKFYSQLRLSLTSYS